MVTTVPVSRPMLARMTLFLFLIVAAAAVAGCAQVEPDYDYLGRNTYGPD